MIKNKIKFDGSKSSQDLEKNLKKEVKAFEYRQLSREVIS